MLIFFIEKKVLERDDTDTFLIQKSLPRLLSTDDAYDLFHRSSTVSHPLVPSTAVDLAPPPPPPSSPYTPSRDANEAHAEDIIRPISARLSMRGRLTSSMRVDEVKIG